MKRPGLSLYVVLDAALCPGHRLVETACAVVSGSAGIVQRRDKNADTAARVTAIRALKAALACSGVPVIVNDDVEAALAGGADGLHVG